MCCAHDFKVLTNFHDCAKMMVRAIVCIMLEPSGKEYARTIELCIMTCIVWFDFMFFIQFLSNDDDVVRFFFFFFFISLCLSISHEHREWSNPNILQSTVIFNGNLYISLCIYIFNMNLFIRYKSYWQSRTIPRMIFTWAIDYIISLIYMLLHLRMRLISTDIKQNIYLKFFSSLKSLFFCLLNIWSNWKFKLKLKIGRILWIYSTVLWLIWMLNERYEMHVVSTVRMYVFSPSRESRCSFIGEICSHFAFRKKKAKSICTQCYKNYPVFPLPWKVFRFWRFLFFISNTIGFCLH